MIWDKPVHRAGKASNAAATRHLLDELEETRLVDEQVQDGNGHLVAVHAEVNRGRIPAFLVNAFVEDSLVYLTLDKLQKTRIQKRREDYTVLLLEFCLQTFQV